MTTTSVLMILRTETPLHAGAGQSVAGIDLPIQREVHTQWPVVFGSAVKGALRAHAECRIETALNQRIDLFGPEPSAAAGERDSSHAGALMVGDAALLMLPVRSLQTCFKWVTCPAAISRFNRHAERLGLALLPWTANTAITKDSAATCKSTETLFLEEFRFQSSESQHVAELASAMAARFDIETEALTDRLVVIHDDIFSFLVRHATAVNAHIAIDSQTKIVRGSALWYEESLPPETILYCPIVATASRRRDSELNSATQVADTFSDMLKQKSWLQLGGNETTGMGWCKVTLERQS